MGFTKSGIYHVFCLEVMVYCSNHNRMQLSNFTDHCRYSTKIWKNTLGSCSEGWIDAKSKLRKNTLRLVLPCLKSNEVKVSIVWIKWVFCLAQNILWSLARLGYRLPCSTQAFAFLGQTQPFGWWQQCGPILQLVYLGLPKATILRLLNDFFIKREKYILSPLNYK